MSTEPEPSPSEPRAGRGSQVFTIFLAVACVALAIEVVLLAQKNRELREAIAQASSGRRPPNIDAGEAFDNLRLIDEAGDEVAIEFGEGQPQTLMLVFTMACPACTRTFPVWSETLPTGDLPGIRVVAVRLDRETEPADESINVLPFPIHSVADGETSLRKITGIPTTLLLNERGVVEKVWTGMFTAEEEQDLRETLARVRAPDP